MSDSVARREWKPLDVEGEYRSHLRAAHNITTKELEDEQGVRVPKTNSQGKMKSFCCKQCEYSTVTKASPVLMRKARLWDKEQQLRWAANQQMWQEGGFQVGFPIFYQ